MLDVNNLFCVCQIVESQSWVKELTSVFTIAWEKQHRLWAFRVQSAWLSDFVLSFPSHDVIPSLRWISNFVWRWQHNLLVVVMPTSKRFNFLQNYFSTCCFVDDEVWRFSQPRIFLSLCFFSSLREWIPITGFLDEMRRCKIVHKRMGQTYSWMSCARRWADPSLGLMMLLSFIFCCSSQILGWVY